MKTNRIRRDASENWEHFCMTIFVLGEGGLPSKEFFFLCCCDANFKKLLIHVGAAEC